MSRCFSVDWGFRNGLFRVIFGLEKGFVVIVFLRDLDWLCSRQVKISFHLVFRGLESRINQLRISQIYRFGELKWICFKDSSYLLITDGNSEIFRWSFGKLIFKISIDGFSSAKSGYGETLVGARLDQLEESMSDLVLIQMRRRLGGCYLGISMRIAVIKVLNIGNFKSSKIIEIVWLVVGSKNGTIEDSRFMVYDLWRFKNNSFVFLNLVHMAQLALNKGKAAMVRTEVVKILGSILSQRIQQFSLTLIGRLMNPSVQRMDSLVANMPKIWKLEDKVTGADLGKGIFQFNFQAEEDLNGVLQNVPYHFNGWMVALVRWEPIISATYPSAINFWVKVSGLPMHLWEEATLKAIGKKIGIIRDLDVDSGSIYVTVNGFNPLVFQMVVPFDTELQKKAGNRLYEEYGDRRGGQRQHNNAKLVSQGQDGGWEKPRKPAAKRALEFSGEEMNGGFRYHSEMGDSNKQSHQKIEKNQGPIWGQKKSFPGTWAESSETLEKVVARDSFKEAHSQSQGTSYGRKGAGPAWPKPLYQPKTVSKETQETKNSEQGDDLGDLAMEDVPEMEDKDINAGIQISESADDLLEDGECQVDEETDNQETMEEITDADGQIIPEGEKIGPQDDVSKQRAAGKNKPKEGAKSGGINRMSKKGMVALPKPPAHT
ncbi:uncharacterized protein LOC9330643 isoform X2 [Arabidopsis lyrata subsp. lyrata]|uniref:uncharacterized protein LOC9330643 isoform X2 n=1 Tax=Arabidopsis lyrata subsp. lyrata TaxID=81972 RepID=UPI000A29E55C|nr:uncharacterized protein LOC9330643 isoform X2 [Arabidopsis lyrata subsp. lyrata]|eukprot:XP_020867963.1 uncharacterized protein LOC9330643 isoform X2 [Arabidopsis lyrata subsp. lyrata]